MEAQVREDAEKKINETHKKFQEAFKKLCDEHSVKGLFIGVLDQAEDVDDGQFMSASFIYSVGIPDMKSRQKRGLLKCLNEVNENLLPKLEKFKGEDDMLKAMARLAGMLGIDKSDIPCNCPNCDKSTK